MALLENQAVIVLVAAILYIVQTAVRRLYLSPLARFPGPKLAALSNWYEFYYDVMLHGQFTEHVQQLHKKYGQSSPAGTFAWVEGGNGSMHEE
jgi:hypothetical protein